LRAASRGEAISPYGAVSDKNFERVTIFVFQNFAHTAGYGIFYLAGSSRR
jgi:hypothetical protein